MAETMEGSKGGGSQGVVNPDSSSQKVRARVLFVAILAILVIAILGWISWHLQWVTTGSGESQSRSLSWVGFYDAAPQEWIDWFYASLIGVLLYTLTSIAYWYARTRARFIEFTPWYVSTIIKGPIITFVVLLFLTSVTIEISGLTVDFTELGAGVWIVAAFVLGFYSRVAREQLNLIVKALFGKAYSRAEEGFRIVPGSAELLFEKSMQFETSPLTEVTWLASAGKIEDGLYTAPKPPDAKSGQEVQVTAVPKDPNLLRATAVVTLRPFEIVGNASVAYRASETYKVAPAPEGGVGWSVSPEIEGASISPEGVYSTPAKDKVGDVERVTILAVSKENAVDLAKLSVSFKE